MDKCVFWSTHFIHFGGAEGCYRQSLGYVLLVWEPGPRVGWGGRAGCLALPRLPYWPGGRAVGGSPSPPGQPGHLTLRGSAVPGGCSIPSPSDSTKGWSHLRSPECWEMICPRCSQRNLTSPGPPNPASLVVSSSPSNC